MSKLAPIICPRCLSKELRIAKATFVTKPYLIHYCLCGWVETRKYRKGLVPMILKDSFNPSMR